MRRLGDFDVHPVCFGAMNLSIEGRPDRKHARATIDAALDEGVTLIDTAAPYGLPDEPHHNAVLVAEVQRAGTRVCTKVGVLRRGESWIHDGAPETLRAMTERSLAALGEIDVLLLHAVDDRVPIEESIGELAQLRDEGKARHIGVSNVDGEQLRRAIATTTIACVQNEISPYVPPNAEVWTLCERNGIAMMAYAPMGGWRAHRTAHEALLQSLGQRYDASPFEIVVAALLAASPLLIPVCGASRPANARSSARAASIALAEDDAASFRAHYWL